MKEEGQRKWGKSQRNPGKEVEVVLTYDENRRAVRRKEGDGNESTREKKDLEEHGWTEGWYQREGTVREEVYDRATWRRMSLYIDPT